MKSYSVSWIPLQWYPCRLSFSVGSFSAYFTFLTGNYAVSPNQVHRANCRCLMFAKHKTHRHFDVESLETNYLALVNMRMQKICINLCIFIILACFLAQILPQLMVYQPSHVAISQLERWMKKSRTSKEYSFVPPTTKPFFRRKHAADCSAIIRGDNQSIAAARNLTFARLTEMELYTLLRHNCTYLYENYYFPTKPLNSVENSTPVAFSILINQHADFTLKVINALYAPQNTFCIHIDIKASILLYKTVQSLARCLPNVFVTDRLESSLWGSYGMVQAVLNCLGELLQRSTRWRYAITVQGHDFPLRTNRELVQILTTFQGANDIELQKMNPNRLTRIKEPVLNNEGATVRFTWKNATHASAPHNIKLFKGNHAATLSREFVEFMLSDPRSLDLQRFMQDMDVPDEMLWSTLVHNEHLNPPGFYPGACLNRSRKRWITRHVAWAWERNDRCFGRRRNSICIFGYKDLAHLTKRPELFVNKFRPDYFDPYALDCMYELLFNKTYRSQQTQVGISWSALRSKIEKLPAVRFQRWRAAGNKTREFDCK